MGRRGRVMTQPAKYGSAVTDWAQRPFYQFLVGKTKLEVNTDNEWAPADADRWEISIPCKSIGRGKNEKFVSDYDYVLKVAERLKARPGLVKDEFNKSPLGDQCAELLEEGVKAARVHKLDFIKIDWE